MVRPQMKLRTIWQAIAVLVFAAVVSVLGCPVPMLAQIHAPKVTIDTGTLEGTRLVTSPRGGPSLAFLMPLNP
jgi:hypothetical protein